MPLPPWRRGPVVFVPPAPVEKLATDQLTPDKATPRVVEVETRPAPSDAVAAPVPLAAPVAFPVAEAADNGRDWMATLLGVLLIALGLVSVLGSSRVLPKGPAVAQPRVVFVLPEALGSKSQPRGEGRSWRKTVIR